MQLIKIKIINRQYDQAGHCFFTRRRAWTAHARLLQKHVIKMQMGGKTQLTCRRNWRWRWRWWRAGRLMLFSPPLFSSCSSSSLLSLCPLFLLYGFLPLLWSLSLSLYCVCTVFFCPLCLFLFFPLVSCFSVCVFYPPLFYVCFLLPGLRFSFSLCSLPGSLVFFTCPSSPLCYVLQIVLCFLFFFVPLSSGFLPVLPLCFLEFPLFASSPSVFSSVPSVLSLTPCGFSLAYIKPENAMRW